MEILAAERIDAVHHFTPLHYLPFIARAKSLLDKRSLLGANFAAQHLRPNSTRQDAERGFGDYTFLTLHASPRILRSKLKAGYAHVDIAVPAEAVEAVAYSLCRFNVAKTRRLRRAGRPGYTESATNGRYYDAHQIPAARDDSDKAAMLRRHLAGSMIEVLVAGELALPDHTRIVCYSEADAATARRVLAHLGRPWAVTTTAPPGPYRPDAGRIMAVQRFIDRALDEPDWRGDGLAFD